MEPKEVGLKDILEIQDNFNFDKEECFTLRYDEECKNLAAGYSTGFVAIYNLEKQESEKEYRKAYNISSFPIKMETF